MCYLTHSDVTTSFLEHLDFMNVLDLPSDTYTQFKQLQHDYIGYQSLTDVPRVLNYQDQLKDYSVGGASNHSNHT